MVAHLSKLAPDCISGEMILAISDILIPQARLRFLGVLDLPQFERSKS